MNFCFWYFCVICPICIVLFVIMAIIDCRILYDITIDGELIRGCRCEFHDRHGYLEITNPETEHTIIVRYQNYSIERVYFKGRKSENDL